MLRLGAWQVKPEIGTIACDGVVSHVSPKAMEVLLCLAHHEGEVVSKDEIFGTVWTETFVSDDALTQCIVELRRAFHDNAREPSIIKTISKRGYLLIPPVVWEGNGNHAALSRILPATSTENAQPTQRTAPVNPSIQSRSLRRKLLAVCAVPVIGIVAAGYWIGRPPPLPRVARTHALTHTGNRKKWLSKPHFNSLYFWEETSHGWVTSQVALEGGEVSQVPSLKGFLADISRDGSQLLFVDHPSRIDPVTVGMQSVTGGASRIIINNAISPFWTGDGRGIFFTRRAPETQPKVDLYKSEADGTGSVLVGSLPGGAGDPHLSPDGTRIRFTDSTHDERLWEIGVNGRDLHLVVPEHNNTWGGAWSPEGRYYFFTEWDGNGWDLWAASERQHWWQRGAGVPQQLTAGPMWFGVPSISSDGKTLYATGEVRKGELAAYDSASRKFVPFLGGISACEVSFSRDGQWVAYISYPEGALWRSRTDGSERLQLTMSPLAATYPHWSPDGKLISFTDVSGGGRNKVQFSGQRRIYVVGANGGGLTLVLARDDIEGGVWGHDSNSVMYWVNTGASSEIRILDLETKKITKIPNAENLLAAQWSPDGKYLVASSAQPSQPHKLMLFSFANEKWEALVPDEDLGWATWSSDSKYVYAQKGDQAVRITLSTGKTDQIASIHGLRNTAVMLDRWGVGWLGFTPDGRPITTLDSGIAEMYALDLEYK